MCLSTTANFVGSGVLGNGGAATLTKVKHGRELLSQRSPRYSPFINLSRDSSGWD